MKDSIKIFVVSLLLVTVWAGADTSASAQALSFSDSSNSMNLTPGAVTGSPGEYELNPAGTHYVSSLADPTASQPNGNLPALSVNLNNGTGTDLQNSSGWVFQLGGTGTNSTSNVWVSNLVLSDPSIFYSIAFQNTTSSAQTYNVSFSVPINPTVSFSPSLVRATVAGSLLSGGSTAATLTPVLNAAPSTGTLGAFLQTSTLTLTTGSTVSSNVDLTPGTETAPGDGGNIIFSAQTFGYNSYNANGPSGTFKSLSVNLAFTLSAGDYASFTGRVDVVPEPDEMALMFAGFCLLVYVSQRRSKRLSL